MVGAPKQSYSHCGSATSVAMMACCMLDLESEAACLRRRGPFETPTPSFAWQSPQDQVHMTTAWAGNEPPMVCLRSVAASQPRDCLLGALSLSNAALQLICTRTLSVQCLAIRLRLDRCVCTAVLQQLHNGYSDAAWMAWLRLPHMPWAAPELPAHTSSIPSLLLYIACPRFAAPRPQQKTRTTG